MAKTTVKRKLFSSKVFPDGTFDPLWTSPKLTIPAGETVVRIAGSWALYSITNPAASRDPNQGYIVREKFNFGDGVPADGNPSREAYFPMQASVTAYPASDPITDSTYWWRESWASNQVSYRTAWTAGVTSPGLDVWMSLQLSRVGIVDGAVTQWGSHCSGWVNIWIVSLA